MVRLSDLVQGQLGTLFDAADTPPASDDSPQPDKPPLLRLSNFPALRAVLEELRAISDGVLTLFDESSASESHHDPAAASPPISALSGAVDAFRPPPSVPSATSEFLEESGFFEKPQVPTVQTGQPEPEPLAVTPSGDLESVYARACAFVAQAVASVRAGETFHPAAGAEIIATLARAFPTVAAEILQPEIDRLVRL